MPVITYPSQTMVPSADLATLFPGGRPQVTLPAATYLHVPFCAFGCHYCHWVKTIGPTEAQLDAFLDEVEAELTLGCRFVGVDRIPTSSILIGGGTPTLLDPARLERLLRAFLARVDVTPCRQFSVEAEPRSLLGPLGAARLKVLRDTGVDRISLGVQSFDDAILARMGRNHSGRDARAAIEAIRKAGFPSLSIDLIYSYPGQTVDDWLGSLETALTDGVDAWHLYRLRIRPHGDVKGVIQNQFEAGTEQFPDLETTYLQKAVGVAFSEEHGYGQHFTRIFARAPEHVTQYMVDYCIRVSDVVGFGPSSWGAYGPVYTLNASVPLTRYSEAVRAGRVPIDRGVRRDADTEARRCLIMPLKNDRVVKARYAARLGFRPEERFAAELARLASLGLLVEDETSLRLTPRGRFFADESVMQLFQRRYLPFPEVAHELTPE